MEAISNALRIINSELDTAYSWLVKRATTDAGEKTIRRIAELAGKSLGFFIWVGGIKWKAKVSLSMRVGTECLFMRGR